YLFDSQQRLERLRKLYEQFRAYVHQLVEVRQGKTHPIVATKEALTLKLHADSRRFQEWHDGELGLHRDIFGLVDHPGDYPTVADIAAAMIPSEPKFEHEITNIEDECRSLQMKIALIENRAPLTLNREGLFVAGQSFDPFRRIQNILATAKNTINLIDNYVDESILDSVAGLGV